MILVLRFGGLGCFGLCGWVVSVWVVFGDCCCLRRWTLLRLWFDAIAYVCGALDFFGAGVFAWVLGVLVICVSIIVGWYSVLVCFSLLVVYCGVILRVLGACLVGWGVDGTSCGCWFYGCRCWWFVWRVVVIAGLCGEWFGWSGGFRLG